MQTPFCRCPLQLYYYFIIWTWNRVEMAHQNVTEKAKSTIIMCTSISPRPRAYFQAVLRTLLLKLSPLKSQFDEFYIFQRNPINV